jgi:hypothetical protein
MVLLFNCFITNQSSTGGVWETLGIKQDRGNLKNDNKIDVLKYTLASLAIMYPWKRVIIKTQLDTNYDTKKIRIELENFIREEFKNFELHFSFKRNLIQQDWIDTYDLVKDNDFIFNCCSHDHIFIDYSSEYIERIIDLVKCDPYPYITILYSHFPDFIRSAKAGPPRHNDLGPEYYQINYKIEENFISYDAYNYDSINIISKTLYEDWYIKGNWDSIYHMYPPNTFKSEHIELPRIDGVGIVDLNFMRNKILNIPTPKQKIIVPYKELARHYDGYFYHGITNNQAPSLDIPIGFFENSIKIRYGYDNRKEGWVNVNPKSENYYAYDKSGADYKFTLEEIPLFWKNRISEIDVNPNIDNEEMIQYRLKAILEMVYTSPNYNSYIDSEVENKILNEYIKSFPAYTLK